MNQNKEQAIALRKEGKSYNQISETLGVPKGTLAYWFKDATWSAELRDQLSLMARENSGIRMRILSGKAKVKRQELYASYRTMAQERFTLHVTDRLFVVGLTIYWGEGDNKLENGIIRVANTDPLMIKLFYQFLKKYLPELGEKAKFYLILYPDLDEEVCKDHWAKLVGMPAGRFLKTQYIVGRTPTKRLAYGIGGIIVSSRAYKEMLLYWINQLKVTEQEMRE